jgi:hypothetical protein
MKLISCQRCGSNEMEEVDDFVVCTFCQSRYVPQADDRPPLDTIISLNSDLERLLEKCKIDPQNRRRYASLALDIDPSNAEARQYLQ